MVTPAQRTRNAQPSQWTPWDPVPGLDFKHILYDRRERTRGGGVARITMNRVERMNSLTPEVFEELNTAFGHANRDNSVGVTVLTHNGPGTFTDLLTVRFTRRERSEVVHAEQMLGIGPDLLDA